MPINGTDLLDAPWETILSPFTDLLGSGFYIIPVSVMAAALFIKTRDIVTVGAFMILAGALLSGGGLWTGYYGMSILYVIFTLIGLVSVVMGLLFRRR